MIGPGSDYNIFTVAPNGRAIQQVTQGPDRDLQPSWSPDGRRIAFVRLDTLLTNSDIFVMESDGSGMTNLTEDYTVNDYTPDWSPQGDKIVFTRRTPSGPILVPTTEIDLYVMNADGSNVVQLTETPGTEATPDWSPDGRLIVFAHSAETSESGGVGPLELIRPDGSGRKVLDVPGRSAFGPHWSPDGKEILYGAGPVGGRDIWIIGRDGSGARNLTPKSGTDDLFAVWSPDATRIAFVSNRDGSYKIYSMRSDGTQVAKLIDIALDESEAQLDWGRRP